MQRPFIIGISGGTASGKTTLAEKIVDHFTGKASVISLDYYYKDFIGENRVDYTKINFDTPQSIDLELFNTHLTDIKSGKSILLPQYDFSTHSRKAQTIKFYVTPIVIVEGLFLFNTLPDSSILFDVKIYAEAPDDLRFIRRLTRDIQERGRTVQTVIEQYLSSVRPMHLKYVEPNRELSDFVFDGSSNFQLSFQRLIEKIDDELKQKQDFSS